ncbi:CDP-diacylglycerol--serine O-phosphatidyltransferase [Jannaschia seohaensis]|uniref:CDP-diacylglycerol--serine O-phosphatidyltransferase n=1 Tax=Jannaschia seohaensis TaxID=475081 RepID=A0A2Y9A886_9RHOB|nr:CDP-diacylglycerol--serine O-phosphatidyltransferase [Jannaschia seohaensis]PWJ22491.1 CDP-diacylglycerol--serine O-phosphatidyltransferase [Jannaschia seohaensis]SSA38769.1 CDP-diacylglycerol---serine O-phosphatidyltransferase [Jannaschia seohaensis]
MAEERGETGRAIGVIALIPNLVTILGLCFGLTAIRFAVDDRYDIAASLLIMAALIDGIDGLLARKLNAASPFGAELDSLSDFVCFGVAPALMVYHFGLKDVLNLGWIAALTFAICCCLRLARFNVATKGETKDSRFFTGVPAPAGAMLGLFPVTLYLAGFVDLRDWQWIVAIWMFAVGGLMIARFPTISLKAMRVSRENAIYVLLGAAVVIGLMLTRIWLFHVCATVLYLALLAWGFLRHRRAA